LPLVTFKIRSGSVLGFALGDSLSCELTELGDPVGRLCKNRLFQYGAGHEKWQPHGNFL